MVLIHIGIGFVLGAAFPGVLRVIRSWFQAEAKVAEAKIVDIKNKL